jgi:NADH-quinone oxidoreductase subunit C
VTENSAEDKAPDEAEEAEAPSEEPLPEDIAEALADAIIEGSASGDHLTLHVRPEAIPAVAEYLRDREAGRYDYVANLCGVDDGDDLGVVYHFGRHCGSAVAAVHVRVPRDDPRLPSIVETHPAANWNEREATEMYGIIFDGHPDPRKLLLPDDWEGFPMRKDYEIPDHPYLRPDPLHELG